MSREAGDTRERSLAHWSEASRREMDAFYCVATADYRELALAHNWAALFSERAARRSPVRVLDVACGSGQFPTALRRYGGLAGPSAPTLLVDLLDPSAFSLHEARASLEPPMRGGRSFECTLQALPEDAIDYDVIWAVHALYALPPAELGDGVEVFLRALAPDGVGIVAHANASSHYLAFYESYLSAFRPGETPYVTGEEVIDAFRAAGADVEVQLVRYEQAVEDRGVLEGFLQRCLFDGSLSLDDMEGDPTLGAYLAARRGADDVTRFEQEVSMMLIRRPS